MTRKVYVVGVGMTKLVKPNTGRNYPDMGKEAVEGALMDAEIPYDIIQQAVCGYIAGDTFCGQKVLYQVGMTGVPIFNVNSNCPTGSTALFLGKQMVEGGIYDITLAVDFEKMAPWPLSGGNYSDRDSLLSRHLEVMSELTGIHNDPLTPQIFGSAGIDYMKKYGATATHLAKIAAKKHCHGSNPRSQTTKDYTVDEILKSRRIYDLLTKLKSCPTSFGAAAAVLMSEEAVIKRGLQKKAVEIVGFEYATDTPAISEEKSMMKVVGYDMTTTAVTRMCNKTGVSPMDIKSPDPPELHDCFVTSEMILCGALQLYGVGEAGKFIDANENTYGGRVFVNPRGGLIAKGHPLGATGLAQCAELSWQLRGEAGKRQVLRARLALQHNLGIRGSVLVALYRKGFQNVSSKI